MTVWLRMEGTGAAQLRREDHRTPASRDRSPREGSIDGCQGSGPVDLLEGFFGLRATGCRCLAKRKLFWRKLRTFDTRIRGLPPFLHRCSADSANAL